MARAWIDSLKSRFPEFFGTIFRWRDLFLILIPARIQAARIRMAKNGELAVFYLTTRFPRKPAARGEYSHGGLVKLTYLAERFPHHFPSASLAYIVTTVGHPLQDEILQIAKLKGLKIIVNHDGVAFPAWAGDQYADLNKISKRILDRADFIVYQSQFSKLSADRYLSPPDVPNEIVYNPVDVDHFIPLAVSKPTDLTLLLGGNQYEQYRLQLALQTLRALLKFVPSARLVVTGNLWLPEREAWNWTSKSLKEMNLTDHVEFVGKYTQAEAPHLYSRAHMLLHTKYADPCPGLVLESLGCGLPVVHVGNGGVPELVGEAGIGLSVEHSWETINLPEPEDMAKAIVSVYNRLEEYSNIARAQAEKFSLEKFVAKHREIFSRVMDAKS